MTNETHFTAFKYIDWPHGRKQIALITAKDISVADALFKESTGIDPTESSSGIVVQISKLATASPVPKA